MFLFAFFVFSIICFIMKGPALDLISSEYYEIVKSALKDGGVASSICEF